MDNSLEALNRAAEKLAVLAAERSVRFVVAESCTAGLVASTLGRVPGISQALCGSAVTYRNDTKIEWLSVSTASIQRHTAVSDVVAVEMARGVLAKTPEASLAAAITGHLGPDAPQGMDGRAYIAIANRSPERQSPGSLQTQVTECLLPSLGTDDAQAIRIFRQERAATMVIEALIQRMRDA
ncbi:MAG: nicotinamide-nucleotide amidohydrolase family protein [Planctomycetota bacterium]